MRNTMHVSIRVATVIPDMGLDEEPISPVSREDTVTNRNPNTTISTAPRMFMCNEGAARMARIRARMPAPTNFIDRSRSVRRTEVSATAAALKSDSPDRILLRMAGPPHQRDDEEQQHRGDAEPPGPLARICGGPPDADGYRGRAEHVSHQRGRRVNARYLDRGGEI